MRQDLGKGSKTMPSYSHLSVFRMGIKKQYSEVQIRLLAEQTNSANVLINLWPSNSKREIVHLTLSFFCS